MSRNAPHKRGAVLWALTHLTI